MNYKSACSVVFIYVRILAPYGKIDIMLMQSVGFQLIILAHCSLWYSSTLCTADRLYL